MLVAAEKLLIDPLVRLRYLIFPFGELRVIEWSDMIDKILDAFVFVVINKKCTVHIIIILSGFAEHIEWVSALGAPEYPISLTFIVRDKLVLIVSVL